MAGYSLQEIVEGMKGKAVTLGWGAVSVFSRARLNHLLVQQYLSRLHELRYLPPFNGQVQDNGGLGWKQQLRMIEFGAPRLSFHTASMNDSKAMLTMNIIGGSLGMRNTRDNSFQGQGDLTEAMGYFVEVEVDLTLVEGKVDRRGRVTLDLANSGQFNSNLLEGQAAKALSNALKSWFAKLPSHQRVFELGFIDYHGFTPLAPKGFILRTQAAPGAALRGADNHGDGAVLAFIRLAGNASEGAPPTASFPYLIPNDKDASGEDLYSATLVVAHDLVEHITDKRLEVLNSLLFPGQQVFTEEDRATPNDLAVFGRITPHHALLTVSPATVTLGAGERQQFDLLDANGTKLTATSWTALSVKSRLAVGDGTITTEGLYTAASAADMGHDTLTVIVTAEYQRGDQVVRASARVFVTHEAITLAPRLGTLAPASESVALVAAHTHGETLSWKLLGPELGALQAQGAGIVFTPDTTRRKAPIALQRIQVEQAGRVRAGVLLLEARFPLRLQPALGAEATRADNTGNNRVKPGQKVCFTFDASDFMPAATPSWRALGDGTVGTDGHYTAPDNLSSGADVVVCDLEQNGVLFTGAYSVLQISTLEEESNWQGLIRFAVTIPTNRSSVYGNGYQQLQVKITVETTPVNGVDYRLTATERASIELVEESSNDGVPALPESSQGIEDDTKYATRTLPNNFKPYGSMRIEDGSFERRLKSDGSTIYETRFLHVNDPRAVVAFFYARFTKDGGGEFSSKDLDPLNGTVEATVMPLPTRAVEDYTMNRQRVKGLDGEGGNEYYFEYRSRDYWQFSYKSANFMTYSFIPGEVKPINTSIIRWEKNHPNEVMVSYTGLIFDDKLDKLEADEKPTAVIEFDDGLEYMRGPLIEAWSNDVDTTAFSPGMAVICNDRLDYIPYKSSEAHAYLSEPVRIRFVDEFGNPHDVEFSYGSKGESGNRNIVSWKVNGLDAKS